MVSVTSLINKVGIFFVVPNNILLHTCSLEKAQKYGSFLNYPLSHEAVWERLYLRKYHTDFDFYPRGRIIYDLSDQTYRIFHDGCIEHAAKELAAAYQAGHAILLRDEHYQCHGCNKEYVHIERII